MLLEVLGIAGKVLEVLEDGGGAVPRVWEQDGLQSLGFRPSFGPSSNQETVAN